MSTRVLVVEDDPLIRELIARTLRAPLYHVVLADRVSEARVALGATETPEVVLVDRSLPDGNGMDFCVEVRAARPGVSLVLMSGAVPEGAAAYADVVLEKPFALKDLQRAVVGALESRIAPVA